MRQLYLIEQADLEALAQRLIEKALEHGAGQAPTLSVREAAKALGVTYDAMLSIVNSGRIRSFKPNGPDSRIRRITRRALEEFIREREAEA